LSEKPLSKKILVLAGDGIGPEIVAQAVKVLKALQADGTIDVSLQDGLVGGAAYDATGHPLPEETLEAARASDAVLLGAVGGPKWDRLPIARRPEKGACWVCARGSVYSPICARRSSIPSWPTPPR
jgi:3-isopropylmalate dehydrogenase